MVEKESKHTLDQVTEKRKRFQTRHKHKEHVRAQTKTSHLDDEINLRTKTGKGLI
jgi:hypothetical protein